jgi:ribonuclease HII
LQHTNGGIIVGGVDEAGRGSIIGPLVVAGISFKKSAVSELHKIGVKDSKALTSKSRISLYAQLREMATSICVYKINCNVIDDNVYLKRLNKLEAKMMARVINNLDADEVYVDSCDVNPDRYEHCIRSYLPAVNPKLHSMHHADRINTVVSAASIVAKITRDKEIEKIRKTHSNIGSGYPCDNKTMGFIREWILKYKYPPSFARKSWRPLRQMVEQLDEYQLDEF